MFFDSCFVLMVYFRVCVVRRRIIVSTAEQCLNCDGSPLMTGECNPQACTTVFTEPIPLGTLKPDSNSPFYRISTVDFICLNCNHGCFIGDNYCSNCGVKLN
jgi:hypothetical protein